jgi:SNF2 family DNA or RNA helicase
MRALSDATAGLLEPVKLKPHDRLSLSLEPDGKHFRAKVSAARVNGHREWPSAAARSTWLERVPERRQLKSTYDEEWLLAATDYTAVVVDAVWPRDQLELDPAAKSMMDLLLLGTTAQDQVAEAYALFKSVGLLPPGAAELEQHPELPLEPYQQAALWMSMRSEGYNLFMEQGTGKTPVVVARVMNECQRVWAEFGRAHRTIVVCPKAVRLNWCREFQRFCTRPGKVCAIRGGAVARAGQLIEALVDEPGCEYTVCVMSYEGLKGTWDFLEHVDWDLGVLDEAHYAKRPMTSRSQYTRKLRDKCRRRMCLTGTPISNTPLDLYALFEFLSEGGSGFQSWKAFKDFYGVFDQTGDGYAKLVGIQNLPFMKERLTRTAFIVTKKEALPWLPDKVFDVMEAEMSTAQQDAYDSLAKELAYSVEDQLDRSGNKAITIQNVLTQLLRLAQITCGFIKWDAVIDEATGEVLREARLEYFPECPKLETLVECLREKGPDEKTIVWSCFVPTIRQVSERLTAEGIRHVTYWGETTEEAREEAERQFNCEPECRVFLGNQGAGGTGLNLLGYPPHEGDGVTTDCNHHIYYAVDWSFIKRDQSGSRNHRRGTRVQVRETDLVVPESIDEDIRVRVGEKKLLAMEVSDVREILGTILAGLVKKRERD